MLSQSRHLGSIAAPPGASGRELEAAVVAAVLILVGLVWLLIGAAIMRGAAARSGPGARTRRLLQRGLADVQTLAAG